MKKPEEKSAEENARIEKLKAEEARLLAKEQVRTKVYLAREQEIEKTQKIKETQRAKDLKEEEIREQAKEKARKDAYLAREKIIADEQEARRLKEKKTS
jgi:hypothetical protein